MRVIALAILLAAAIFLVGAVMFAAWLVLLPVPAGS